MNWRRGDWVAGGWWLEKKGLLPSPATNHQPPATSHPPPATIKRGKGMRQARILMCPPDYYGIEYEINPWMSRSRGSTPDKARQQWMALYETLCGLGVAVERMTPQPGL